MINILIDSISFTKIKPTADSEYIYDMIDGVWKNAEGNLLVEESLDFSGGTKKCDIETGEDVKGE